MLDKHDSSAIVAVSDLERARSFYSDTLGLPLASEGGEEDVPTYQTGGTRLVVYASEYAGGNKGNAVVWGVGDDMDSIVASLRAKGASFEHYPELGRYRDGIHEADGMKLAWLKDPDGNILHLNNM